MKRLTYITQCKDMDYYLFRYMFGYKKEDKPVKVFNARRGKFGKVLFDKNGFWCIYRYSNRDEV